MSCVRRSRFQVYFELSVVRTKPPNVVQAGSEKGWAALGHTLLDNRYGETVHNLSHFIEIRPCLSVSMVPAIARDVPDCGNHAKQNKTQMSL